MKPLNDSQNNRYLPHADLLTQSRFKPYRQGSMDGYCGVYCVVNAVHYLRGPINSTQAEKLFIRAMSYLERSSGALNRLKHGTSFEELCAVFEHVVYKPYDIIWSRPFYRKRGVTLELLWKHIGSFVANKHGIAVLGLGGENEHWSLVKKVTQHSLILFDSDGFFRLPRKNCTTSEKHGSRAHVLQATYILYLWVETAESDKEES